MMFKAFRVQVDSDGNIHRNIVDQSIEELPNNDVLIKVHWSSLNYKDALSASGNRGVTRNYPHTPGIDAAGIVAESRAEGVHVGDKVIVTSYDLGMNTAGGFAEYIRVPAEWIVPLPQEMDLREAMLFGTAGFTAGMSVWAVHQAVPVNRGEIVVSGATGGVGSLAVAILSHLGYSVVGVSGKKDASPFLKGLGASRIISRDELMEGADKPLLKVRWAGAVDTVGGDILAALVKATAPCGVVTCCGNVASAELPLNVYPFILRGVSLQGIDSQNCPMELRRTVWTHLASDWKPMALNSLGREVELVNIEAEIEKILKGGQMGRVLVKIND